ncbi:MAG: ABC transporter ATP-binding protein [Phycisphaerales bacterium]|nr:ABC transporter ATP-binding protein [Phycisphaerales bacterium]
MTPSTPSADTTISVRGVGKTFPAVARESRGRAVEALRGANLEIREPGFFAVMGRSGSGKSTLLHLLAGLDQPDCGELWVGGSAIHAMTEAQLVLYRRRSIGIIFQQFNLLPTLDALENTILPGVLDRRPRKELEARGEELLAELGLQGRIHHRPDALSGGEQQRVAIARALLFSPPVIFADEPTGNLDSVSSEVLWRLLREIASRHQVIVLMVTHEAVAAAQCQRTFILHDGRVVGEFESYGIDPAELAHRTTELARPS